MDNSGKPLRVFEAFSGIGAQASALKRLGANYKKSLTLPQKEA